MTLRIALIGAAASLLTAFQASAQDVIRVAAPHPTALQSTPIRLGEMLGFFEKENIKVETIFTQGGSDIQNAVISGSVDIGLQTGMAGVLSAIQQGAPVKIISADMTGAGDFYWYVRADSDIQSFADLQDNETIGFSRPGSSSELVVKALIEHNGAKATGLPSGSPPETLTQVMSGQVDVGWGVPPVPKEVAEGTLRIVARGNDVPTLKAQTVRVNIANADYLENNRETVERFLTALDATIDALYEDPKALAAAAELIKVDEASARQILTEFFPRDSMNLGTIGDLDGAIAQATANKQLRGELSDEQKSEITQTVKELND
ncbi:ABC transporter substrate-binding protein [Aquibium sp. LZ166]|uniref:ABC transporter substrate-binding protein n=1 Tax=Aquibium pacificus TaxID=3153579 RepID=A0ABV3SET2_9HYPH